MKEEENIIAYFLRVDEIVNVIKGLGEKVGEPVIVQKILKSLPMRFDSKISAIEERLDLDTMTMDELHGTLTAYEMRIEQEDLVGKEASFKVTNKRRTSKQKPKSEYNSDDDESDNEEEANFVRKLKRGIGKYKGKIPLNALNVVGLVTLLLNVPTREIQTMMMKIDARKTRGTKRTRKETMEGMTRT